MSICTAKCLVHYENLWTFELTYPRYIHSEFMTHRCLTADTVLTFDLPSGSRDSKHRSYQMTLGDFWDKWENGSAPHATRWGGSRRYDMKGRLNKMRLRSVDESTMEVTHTTITDCWKVGIKPVYKLTAGDFSITCTADHLILTDSGWKELQDINISKDKVYCNTRKKYTEPYFDPYKKINGEWVSRWNKKVKPEVFERQEFRCADCGAENKPLEIHHVIPRHENPDLAFDINNVVALCQDCHKLRHSKQGWQGVSQCNVTAVEVDSIEYVGEEEVFDISVSSEYHNFLANGITVHNCFSRNASSSRAIPVKRMIEQVENNPVIPPKIFMNQRGMVGETEADEATTTAFHVLWKEAAENACKTAEMMNKLGIHKQHINRILEPSQFIHVIVTATEWDNFFALRLAPDAQPEMQDLANAIYNEMHKFKDKEFGYITHYYGDGSLCSVLNGDYTLITVPYITEDDCELLGDDYDFLTIMKISAARCARVSYNNHDGSKPDIHKDLELFERLYKGGHMSPLEHTCLRNIDYVQSANLMGWESLRYLLENSKAELN